MYVLNNVEVSAEEWMYFYDEWMDVLFWGPKSKVGYY